MTLPLSSATVLLVASNEVGQHEIGGNNRGPRVEQYLAAVDVPPGEPWCAAFVAWVMAQAGVQGWERTGFCPRLYSWAKERGMLRKEASPGDVFLLLDGPGPNGACHTGFVERVNAGYIATIEGNTGMASDRDGDGVCRKSRAAYDCAFIHWQDALHLAATAPEPSHAIKVYWHDGRGSAVVDGITRPVSGVKINGVPWAGGEIVVGC